MNIDKLKEQQRIFMQDASLLGDYNLMTKTELANGFCDADDAWFNAKQENDVAKISYYDRLRSAYNSALMLRYWYKIFEWMNNSASLHLEPIEFVDWLYQGLWVAFYYRTWRWEYEAKCKHGRFIEWKLDENNNRIPNKYYWHTDPNSPDKMINRCCASIRGKEYQYYNMQMRKNNVQTLSLDTLLDDKGDFIMSYAGDSIKEEKPIYDNGAKILVQTLLKRGDNIQALIIDGIANYDSFKETKTKDKKEYEFSPRKLIKHLNSIDENFIQDFCDMYDIEKIEGDNILEQLKRMNNTKLYKLIELMQNNFKKSPELVECLMN